jgi:hypothetical protein
MNQAPLPVHGEFAMLFILADRLYSVEDVVRPGQSSFAGREEKN